MNISSVVPSIDTVPETMTDLEKVDRDYTGDARNTSCSK